MRVRRAVPSDLSAIVALGARLHARTNYASMPYNAVNARRTLKGALSHADSRVWVTEHRGQLKGVLIGEIGLIPWTHYLGATDTVFAAEGGGELLLDAFLEWCKLRGVARVDMGVSAGPGRERALKRVMARKGLTYSGPMFHIDLRGEAQ